MIEPNTTTGSDELDRDKLAKVLGMLGSSHDGEALAAARTADSLIRETGLTWQRVLRHNSVAEDACRALLAKE